MGNLIFINYFISIKCLYQRFFVTCFAKSCEMRGGRIRVKGEYSYWIWGGRNQKWCRSIVLIWNEYNQFTYLLFCTISKMQYFWLFHILIGVYIHVYLKRRYIFSFYSDFGFYTVRPGRLERSAKAFLLWPAYLLSPFVSDRKNQCKGMGTERYLRLQETKEKSGFVHAFSKL